MASNEPTQSAGYTNIARIIDENGPATLNNLQATRTQLITKLIEVQNEIADVELQILIRAGGNHVTIKSD